MQGRQLRELVEENRLAHRPPHGHGCAKPCSLPRSRSLVSAPSRSPPRRSSSMLASSTGRERRRGRRIALSTRAILRAPRQPARRDQRRVVRRPRHGPPPCDGDDFRRVATDSEVARMRELVAEEMSAGALGLSTGLEYDPGIFSAPAEVLELAKVAGAMGGRYISHMRSEDRDFWQALDELITIGRVAKMPVQVSHMKLAMRALWGQGDRLIETLNRARAGGVQVTADVYPYTMWQSTLTVLYPKRNFSDRAETDFILKHVAAPEDLVIGDFALDTTYVGKDVGQIAAIRKSDPAT